MAVIIRDTNTYVRWIFTSEVPYHKLISSGNATEGDVILDIAEGAGGGILHTHDTDFHFVDELALDERFKNLHNIFLAYDTPLEDGKGEKKITVDKIRTSEWGIPAIDDREIDTILSFEFIESTEKFLARFWDDVTVWAEQLLLKPKRGNKREIDVYEEIMDNRFGTWGEINNDDPENFINFRKDFAVRMNDGTIFFIKDIDWTVMGRDGKIDFSYYNPVFKDKLWTDTEFGSSEYIACFIEIISLGDTTKVGNQIYLYGGNHANHHLYENLHTSDGKPFICNYMNELTGNYPYKQGYIIDNKNESGRLYDITIPPRSIFSFFDFYFTYHCNIPNEISPFDLGTIDHLYTFKLDSETVDVSYSDIFKNTNIYDLRTIHINTDNVQSITLEPYDKKTNPGLSLFKEINFENWIPTPNDRGSEDYWEENYNKWLRQIKVVHPFILCTVGEQYKNKIFDATVFDFSNIECIASILANNFYGLKIALPNVKYVDSGSSYTHESGTLKYIEITELGTLEDGCNNFFLSNNITSTGKCSDLETVIINMSNVTNTSLMFNYDANHPGFPRCTTVHLTGIKVDINISAFMNISLESVQYIMDNAQVPMNGNATLILYEGVYHRLMNMDVVPEYVDNFISKGWSLTYDNSEKSSILDFYYNHGCVDHAELELIESELYQSMVPANNQVLYRTTDNNAIQISEDPNNLIDSNIYYKRKGLGVITYKQDITIFDSKCEGTNISEIILPISVTQIASSLFFNCYNLTTVTAYGNIERIDDLAFGNCKSLLTINANLNTLNYIGTYCFNNCKLLNTTNLPGLIDGLNLGTSIQTRAFSETYLNFSALKLKNSPGYSAFSTCIINDLYFNNNSDNIFAYAFDNTKINTVTINNVVNILDGAFSNSVIDTLIINNANNIHANAFINTIIKHIIINSSTFEDYTSWLANCNLSQTLSIIIGCTTKVVDLQCFETNRTFNNNIHIYVPNELYDEYCHTYANLEEDNENAHPRIEHLIHPISDSEFVVHIINDVVDISKCDTYSEKKAITLKAAAVSIKNAIDGLIAGAPGTYDTLKEITDYIEHHEDVKTAIINFTGRSHAWYDADADAGFTYPDDDLMNNEKGDDAEEHEPYKGRTE